MDTLPPKLPAEPLLHDWLCECCGLPSDLWVWDWDPWPDPGDGQPPPVLCSSCLAALKYPEDRDAQRNLLEEIDRLVRKQADLPGGTIIRWSENAIKGTKPGGVQRFYADVFAVVVSNWERATLDDLGDVEDSDAPLFLTDLNLPVDGWANGGTLVVLGGFVHAGVDAKDQDIPAGWLIFRSLQRPDAPPSCQLLPAEVALNADQLRRLEVARGAFLERRDPRDRPSGSGRFETVQDFEAAVFAAVAAL